MRRASIILSATSGESNTYISHQWQLDHNQVRYWRQRWLDNQERLALCEQVDDSEQELKQQMLATLTDAPRPGIPPTFTPEQVVQIVAIACESPQTSGRAVSHQWTLEKMADEVIKRGIVPHLLWDVFWGEAELQPHRSRYWLNANPEDPEAF